jgi:hypothetical protein
MSSERHNLTPTVLDLTHSMSLLETKSDLTMRTSQKYNHDADECTVKTVLTSESSPTTSTFTKHKLRFSLESNQVFPIIHINDMDLKHIQEIWYNTEEFGNIKHDIISDLKRMIRGQEEFAESNTQTARGLVYRTRQVTLHRKQNKTTARTAVLDEQQRHLLTGERDDELVANAYLRASIHCKGEAYSVGLADQAAIKKELDEMRRTHRTINTGGFQMNLQGPNDLLMEALPPPFRVVACLAA